MSDHSEHHIVPLKVYFLVFSALMILLFVTVGVAMVNLGPFNIYVAMSIAIIKAVLVVLYFMHVRYSTKLTMVVAAAGFLWLVFLLGITILDYTSRSWIPGSYQ
ncbi:MAG TPA: cytochrome C oxidase subunit IV family protein [Candidatus Kapabacteria bacterium]|nr:cytochrome C oxidase subunit IV family protein [Candidatus Kapabacteria bacterium]